MMIKNWEHREQVKAILKQKWELVDHECMICQNPAVERHEKLFGRGKREKSIEFSLLAWLCPIHHRDHKLGAHHNKVLQVKLKLHGKQDFIDACLEVGYTPVAAEGLFNFEFGGVKE